MGEGDQGCRHQAGQLVALAAFPTVKTYMPLTYWVIGFETVPLIGIELICGVRKPLMEFPDHARIFKGFEAKKHQIVLAQERRDLRIVKQCSMTLNSRSRQPLML